VPELQQLPPVGVLVVHGIGAQTPGEALGKLWSGLHRAFPDLPEGPRQAEPFTIRHPDTSSERSVRFYEVHWADLLTGDSRRL
jgi:hypothetical protein